MHHRQYEARKWTQDVVTRYLSELVCDLQSSLWLGANWDIPSESNGETADI